jgi:hypothetical protein
MPQTPPDHVDVPVEIKPPPRDEPPAAQSDLIDPGAFAVKLWNPLPPPSTPETLAATSEPPVPLKLQLIGIITEQEVHRAAVYDPDSDRLLIVSGGDRIDHHTITQVTSSTVELSDGQSTRTLTLKEDHS